MKTKVAIYARVSSQDKCPSCKKQAERAGAGKMLCRSCGIEFQGKSQDYENQLLQLREHAIEQGWDIVAEFVDRKSAKNGERDQFKAMFEAASRREFDIVLVWALDRFTREGILGTFTYIENLIRVGCQFYSFTEPQFRTTGPTGELMIAIAAWMAKQEREQLRSRIRAGMERARAAGQRFGRPPMCINTVKVMDLHQDGLSLGRIAAEMKTSKATIERIVRKARGGGPKPKPLNYSI